MRYLKKFEKFEWEGDSTFKEIDYPDLEEWCINHKKLRYPEIKKLIIKTSNLLKSTFGLSDYDSNSPYENKSIQIHGRVGDHLWLSGDIYICIRYIGMYDYITINFYDDSYMILQSSYEISDDNGSIDSYICDEQIGLVDCIRHLLNFQNVLT